MKLQHLLSMKTIFPISILDINVWPTHQLAGNHCQTWVEMIRKVLGAAICSQSKKVEQESAPQKLQFDEASSFGTKLKYATSDHE